MKFAMPVAKSKIHRPHRYQWVIDALADQPSFVQKKMFGAEACYLHGRLVLALISRDDKVWKGILVPTERIHHRTLRQQFSGLQVHPTLKKWLYLPESHEAFEEVANALVSSILEGDFRIGVESSRPP